MTFLVLAFRLESQCYQYALCTRGRWVGRLAPLVKMLSCCIRDAWELEAPAVCFRGRHSRLTAPGSSPAAPPKREDRAVSNKHVTFFVSFD